MSVQPYAYESEEVFQIPVAGDEKCFVVSGYARFYNGSADDDSHPLHCSIKGGGDGSSDARWFGTEVHMIVGPKWASVSHVAPVVAIAGISFRDSDTTDHTGYMVNEASWDTVEVDDGSLLKHQRIRLKIWFSMCGGEQSAIVKVSYHLTALGKLFTIKHPIHLPV